MYFYGVLEPVFTNNYLINFNICEIYPSLTKFSADKFVCSKSFAKRPDQPNHANVRSTIQRLGRISQEISWIFFEISQLNPIALILHAQMYSNNLRLHRNLLNSDRSQTLFLLQKYLLLCHEYWLHEPQQITQRINSYMSLTTFDFFYLHQNLYHVY